MRRGLLRAYLDLNKGLHHQQQNDVKEKRRRPSRIEERIRLRKLRGNPTKNSLKSPEPFIGGNLQSVDYSSPKTSSGSINSSGSCSSDNLPKNRDSKQRVDLLELHASSRTPLTHIRAKKPKPRAKINGERLGSLLRSPSKIRARAKSAPCTPLFEIKYAKNFRNCNHDWGGPGEKFVDCKIVENDCIAVISGDKFLENGTEDEGVDLQPIGNPALISVMKESLGEIEDLKPEKSRQEVIDEELEDPQSDKSNCSNEIGEIPGLREPEVPSKASETSNEFSKEIREEVEEFSEHLEDEDRDFGKPSNKCHCDIGHHSNFNEAREISSRSEDCDGMKIPNADFNARRCSACCGNLIRNHRPESMVKKCETGIIRCCKNPARERNCAEKLRGCSLCTKFDNPRSKFESNRDIPRLNIEPIVKCHSISKSSCNCCNHRTGVKCWSKISGQRSKSTPRRVTFCLPSLIPEELEGGCSGGEDKIVESCSQIWKRDSILCSGRKESGRNNSGELEELVNGSSNSVLQRDSTVEKSGRRYSRCDFHSRKICGCKFERKSRSPRVHFCREIISKHQDILRADFPDQNQQSKGELLKDSESKTSITSDKEWADSAVAQEDLNSFDDISFPKETRQAMSVLMQSRARSLQKVENSHGSFPAGNEELPLKEARVSEKQDLGVFDNAGHKAMHVATYYAQALAVFQRTCDPLQEPGGSCKKKRHIVWKGSDGEIDSEYTTESEYNNLHNIVKQVTNNARSKEEYNNRRRNNGRINFLRNKFDPKSKNKYLNHVPERPTGLKMQTNGSDNGSSENGVDRTGWTVGLINGRFKYLTAETFGFKINANGASLKKKQLWTLEGSEHQVFLRSHLDRYLAVDQFGNVTCEAEDTADPGCAFQIQVASDGSGRWALKNIQRGYFLGSSQDELKCTAKVPGDAEYWLVHLAARPQVNLRSAGRKRFAHLSAAQDEIHVDAPVPWGEDTLFTLEFRPAAMPDNVDGNSDARRDVRSEAGIGGHYALHTCNNKYLARDGKLLDSCTRDCLYAAEFHAGMLALRDVSGAYLAPIGSKAVLKSRSNTVTRDELFSLEDSLPQASFVAALNQRYVSVKQGVDVTANQDEISGHETFQLEFDRATKRWYLRTMQDRYWTLEAGGGIQASDHKRSSNALFDLVWQPADGTVALRANNGKFLATKRSGHLYANADSPGESEASKFYFYLMNRPVLVLRCEQGFVGLKSNASPKLECNKASYETIRVERCDRGIVRFKGQNGKYWHADSEGVTSDADVPSDGFYLELREPSRICIKSTDGRYLSAGKNGVFRLGDTDYESATKWEF